MTAQTTTERVPTTNEAVLARRRLMTRPASTLPRWLRAIAKKRALAIEQLKKDYGKIAADIEDPDRYANLFTDFDQSVIDHTRWQHWHRVHEGLIRTQEIIKQLDFELEYADLSDHTATIRGYKGVSVGQTIAVYYPHAKKFYDALFKYMQTIGSYLSLYIDILTKIRNRQKPPDKELDFLKKYGSLYKLCDSTQRALERIVQEMIPHSAVARATLDCDQLPLGSNQPISLARQGRVTLNVKTQGIKPEDTQVIVLTTSSSQKQFSPGDSLNLEEVAHVPDTWKFDFEYTHQEGSESEMRTFRIPLGTTRVTFEGETTMSWFSQGIGMAENVRRQGVALLDPTDPFASAVGQVYLFSDDGGRASTVYHHNEQKESYVMDTQLTPRAYVLTTDAEQSQIEITGGKAKTGQVATVHANKSQHLRFDCHELMLESNTALWQVAVRIHCNGHTKTLHFTREMSADSSEWLVYHQHRINESVIGLGLPTYKQVFGQGDTPNADAYTHTQLERLPKVDESPVTSKHQQPLTQALVSLQATLEKRIRPEQVSHESARQVTSALENWSGSL